DAVEALLAERLALAGEGADAGLDAPVARELRAGRDLVGEDEAVDRLAVELAARKQRGGEARADEAAPASDQDLHRRVLLLLVVNGSAVRMRRSPPRMCWTARRRASAGSPAAIASTIA